MKRLFRLALGVCLIASGSSAAQAVPASSATEPAADTKAVPLDPSSLAVSHQILAIAFPAEKRSQLFSALMDSVVDQNRRNMESLGLTSDKDFQAIIDRSTQRMFNQLKVTMTAALPDYFESMARAYARSFSSDDLKAILAFVRTTAGRHYFERAPQLLNDADVKAANQRMMAQMLAKMPDVIREDKKDIDDYLAKKAKQDKSVSLKPVT